MQALKSYMTHNRNFLNKATFVRQSNLFQRLSSPLSIKETSLYVLNLKIHFFKNDGDSCYDIHIRIDSPHPERSIMKDVVYFDLDTFEKYSCTAISPVMSVNPYTKCMSVNSAFVNGCMFIMRRPKLG
ncbi:hypothetical protein CEXT_388351 [Caerostris extrusa]|uniref:Uncharacterized protein n=1 Tax=Caerostris extrusa TaxID=172846 RepID=A0AAV4QVA2_CAEEX|nr:hypothetical protein CEXT_388351 [Caerostris extrusa]